MVVDHWEFVTPDGTFSTLEHGELSQPIPGHSPQPGDFTLVNKYGTRYEFDHFGRLVQTVDRNDNRTRYDYIDANMDGRQNELSQITLQGGLTYQYNYSGSHLESISDFAGRTTHDNIADGFVVLVIEPDPEFGDYGPNSPISQFQYNGPGDCLSSIQDANGHTTSVQYDPVHHRVTTVTNADQTSFTVRAYLTDGLASQTDSAEIRKPASGAIGNAAPPPGGSFVEPRAQHIDSNNRRRRVAGHQCCAVGGVDLRDSPRRVDG